MKKMYKQFALSLLGILSAFVIILGAAKLFGPLPLSISQTTTNKQNTFDVSGDGEVTTTPDKAVISVGISTSENTVTLAQDKGNKVIALMTSDLKKLGINAGDLKTSNYNLYPNYDYRSGSQKIIGYNLSVNLEVTIKDFNKINDVIDTATKDGANQVGGVTFALSDDKRRQIEDEARTLAINRAKDKANSLARIAGIRLGKIINVTENTNQRIMPIPMMAKTLDASQAVGAPTEISTGSTTLSMSVTLSYETN